jgi:hypothetical protein
MVVTTITPTINWGRAATAITAIKVSAAITTVFAAVTAVATTAVPRCCYWLIVAWPAPNVATVVCRHLPLPPAFPPQPMPLFLPPPSSLINSVGGHVPTYTSIWILEIAAKIWRDFGVGGLVESYYFVRQIEVPGGRFIGWTNTFLSTPQIASGHYFVECICSKVKGNQLFLPQAQKIIIALLFWGVPLILTPV